MTLIKPQGLFSDTNMNRIEFILIEQAFSFNSRPHPQYYNFPWTVEIRRKEVNEYFGSEYLKKKLVSSPNENKSDKIPWI